MTWPTERVNIREIERAVEGDDWKLILAALRSTPEDHRPHAIDTKGRDADRT